MKESYKELMEHDAFAELEEKTIATMLSSLRDIGSTNKIRVCTSVFNEGDGRTYTYILVRESKEFNDGCTD